MSPARFALDYDHTDPLRPAVIAADLPQNISATASGRPRPAKLTMTRPDGKPLAA